jgi:hypothetical protein
MKDKTGETYNRLTIIGFDKLVVKNNKYRYFWNCKCECGIIKAVVYDNLINGHTKSCGCFKTKHGYSSFGKVSSEYRTWNAMLQRCTNPKNTNYYKYGKIGITVCNEWLSFSSFIKDMGNKPGKGYSIDRIDGTKGYYKENCRWATTLQQNNNLKSNRQVINTLTNQKFNSIAEAARSINITPDNLYRKLIKNINNDTNFKII